MKFLLPLLLTLLSLPLSAQDTETTKPDPYAGRFTVLAGLTQPILLSGVNLAVTYFTPRLSFEYSHGQWLTYPAAIRDENLDRLHSPYSTGFGVGYRFTRAFDVRLEFKANGYQADLPNGEPLRYTTYVIGAGAYYRFLLWQRVVIEPSVRFWPNLATTLPDDQHTYALPDGGTLTHQANDYGLFANVSLGWKF